MGYNCTIFLCSLDVGNIDDQCRGPSIKGKDVLAGPDIFAKSVCLPTLFWFTQGLQVSL